MIQFQCDLEWSNQQLFVTYVHQNDIQNVNKIIELFFAVGVCVLTFALFMSARMGIYQEQVYKQYGKHPSEALFYNVSQSHILRLAAYSYGVPNK